MSPASNPSANASEERRIWLALLLLVGLLLTVVGESISAAGAPEVGVVDAWGRVDEAVSRIADWPLLLVAILAALTMLGGLRHERVSMEARNGRVAWIGAIAALGVLAVASVVGIAATSERVAHAGAVGGEGSVDYYSGTEVAGEAIGYVAILFVAIGIAAMLVKGRRTEPTVQRDHQG